MMRSIGYPATNQEEARARARADIEENGWLVVEAHWHPHPLDEGGVLVVHVSEPQGSRSERDASDPHPPLTPDDLPDEVRTKRQE